jgi:hypothetical protein
VLQLQLCCFIRGIGSACCSPRLLLDVDAMRFMQPLPCSPPCLLPVLRALNERCSHRARVSIFATGDALEQVLRRFPSRAHEEAEGGAACTWVGAAAAQGHVVCRVADCVILRIGSDEDAGRGVVQAEGVTADVAGDGADAVHKVTAANARVLRQSTFWCMERRI